MRRSSWGPSRRRSRAAPARPGAQGAAARRARLADVSPGGLGSFALALMAIAHLQEEAKARIIPPFSMPSRVGRSLAIVASLIIFHGCARCCGFWGRLDCTVLPWVVSRKACYDQPELPAAHALPAMH